MAQETTLEVYTFQVRKSGIKGNYEDLSLFPKKEANFYDFMTHYFTYHTTEPIFNTVLQKAIVISTANRTFDNNNRTISGIMESGDFGKEGTILDMKGKVNYKKKKEESDVQPFYYLVYLPDQSNMGYIILQRSGVHGINKIFTGNIETKFNLDYPNYTFEVNPFVSREFAQKVAAEGIVKEIVLRQHNLPSDISDKFGKGNNILKNNMSKMKIIISLDGSKILGKRAAKKFLTNENTAFFDIPSSLQSMGFDGNHKTSIKVDIKGKIRTIDLSSTGLIRPYFDISDEVKTQPNGHPKFDSINTIAKQLIFDLTSKSIK